MRVELCEDDGFLFNGTPKSIVVLVTADDGRKVKFPYNAKNSLAKLYMDAREFCINVPHSTFIDNSELAMSKLSLRDSSKDKHFTLADPNKIEREDIVRCIMLEKREDSCSLKVGGEYRILKVHRKDFPTGPNGEMQTVYDGYDVVDDNSPNPIRTMVFPHEVTLLRKRTPPNQKVRILEEIINCGFCQEPNALPLNEEKNKYIGSCSKCSQPIEAERPSVKSTNKAS